jgi:hypothetical protein
MSELRSALISSGITVSINSGGKSPSHPQRLETITARRERRAENDFDTSMFYSSTITR